MDDETKTFTLTLDQLEFVKDLVEQEISEYDEDADDANEEDLPVLLKILEILNQ